MANAYQISISELHGLDLGAELSKQPNPELNEMEKDLIDWFRDLNAVGKMGFLQTRNTIKSLYRHFHDKELVKIWFTREMKDLKAGSGDYKDVPQAQHYIRFLLNELEDECEKEKNGEDE